MATAQQIKLLVKSHYEDDDRFKSIVLQIAASEAQKGHTSFARDLKSLLDKNINRRNILIKPDSETNELIDFVLPKQDFSEFVGDLDLNNTLERILKEYHHQDRLKKFNMRNRRKFLLAGPPGTGKTMTASIIAKELDLSLGIIQMDKMLTKYMGETSLKLRQIFGTISDFRGVYLFDEFDAIGSKRNLDNDIGEIRRVLNSFLQLIEADNSDSIIIVATNNPNMLDSALFRRFDDVIQYNLPKKNEIEKLIRNRFAAFNINFNFEDSTIKKCLNLSQAEIVRVCEDCVKEIILKDESNISKEIIEKIIDERQKVYIREDK